MSNKSDLTLGLCLSDENIQVMKRFCDSVDFLKQASQSGAEVKLQWPENPTPAPATAAPIAPAPIPAPVAPAPSVNPTPAVSASVPIPGYMPGVQPQTAVPTTTPAPNFTPAIPSMAPTSAPTYTLDQLTKAGAELAQAGKMPQLLGLLQQFRIQAVNMLPKEQYGAFAMALRGLGAQL